MRPALGLHGRAWVVGGQVEDRRASQGLSPVGQAAVQHLALQPLPLPDGEVGVADAQRRQGRDSASSEGGVGLGEVAEQHAGRPAVEGDVVHAQQERVLIGPETPQGRAQDGSFGQVERPPRLAGEALVQRGLIGDCLHR